MAHCINRKCGREIRDEFYFCPACGADNRPPGKRVRLVNHLHEYPYADLLYCIWCGEPPDEPCEMSHRTRLGLGQTLLCFGLLVALFGGYWSMFVPKVGDQFGATFAAWHNEEHQYTQRGSSRFLGDPSIRRMKSSTTGQRTAGLIVLGGVLVGGVGVLLLAKFKFDPNLPLAG